MDKNKSICKKVYPFKCPRCGFINYLITNDPYCQDCNWDSLVDPILEKISASNQKNEKKEQTDEL